MKHILPLDELREEIEREVREWLKREAEPEYLACVTYECDGRRRFIVYGTCPTTGTRADKLFSQLRKEFGLSKKRGPKKIALDRIMKKIEELPDDDATLSAVAGALGVGERTIERAIAPLRAIDKAWGTFDGLKAAIKGKGKPRFKKSFFKKIRRR